jgi:nucleoside-diphosphate-sugar epimerase
MVHVVIGGGPVGRETVKMLLSRGERVRLVSRTNRMESLPGRLEVILADATVPESLGGALEGADVIYNCANAPYHRWPQELPPIWGGILEAVKREAARRTADREDAPPLRYVIASNLYAFGAPGPSADPGAEALTAQNAFAPCSRKGRVRATLEEEALTAGVDTDNLLVGIVRASDFYGPEVRESVLGERFFEPLIAGKAATLYGRDVPHSYAFVPDIARTNADLGTAPPTKELWNRSWIAPHAPAVTASHLEEILRELTVGPKIKIMGAGTVRLGALFVPAAREMIEMLYEFTQPFTVDSSETTRVLGTGATALADGLAETLAWYRGSERAQEETEDERLAATQAPQAPHP